MDNSTGTCPACGRRAVFGPYTKNVRESGKCSKCGASNRKRQLAFIIRRVYGLQVTRRVTIPGSILNTEARGALHEALRLNPGYSATEYFGPTFQSGQVVNGIRHEDLQALSCADESIDLLLSSDVFEHVPDYYNGHREVYRVLKPGGRHIFTVPFGRTIRDEVRAVMDNGKIQHLKEPMLHGDPMNPEGVLVFVVFGMEMLSRLADLGFQVRTYVVHEPTYGIPDYGLVFDAVRPLSDRSVSNARHRITTTRTRRRKKPHTSGQNGPAGLPR